MHIFVDTDWKNAPSNALIQPKWSPNATDEFVTGISYEFRCESVGILFLKDPYILSAKMKNGSVIQLAGYK